VTDESNAETNKNAQASRRRRAVGGYPLDGRYAQRNLASRLFPGPSPIMSDQIARRIEGLLTPDGDTSTTTRPGRKPAPTATDEVREKLEEQNDLLRAILASTVDTQEDARATAQNSRTFAWASIAIALLTLIATVIAVVAAVQSQ
jgi:hypothetical protein